MIISLCAVALQYTNKRAPMITRFAVAAVAVLFWLNLFDVAPVHAETAPLLVCLARLYVALTAAAMLVALTAFERNTRDIAVLIDGFAKVAASASASARACFADDIRTASDMREADVVGILFSSMLPVLNIIIAIIMTENDCGGLALTIFVVDALLVADLILMLKSTRVPIERLPKLQWDGSRLIYPPNEPSYKYTLTFADNAEARALIDADNALQTDIVRALALPANESGLDSKALDALLAGHPRIAPASAVDAAHALVTAPRMADDPMILSRALRAATHSALVARRLHCLIAATQTIGRDKAVELVAAHYN